MNGREILRWLCGLAVLLAAGPAIAGCVVTPDIKADLGSASPAAIQLRAVPAIRTGGGAACNGALLTLLGGNYVRATVTSANGFTMKPATGTARIAIDVSADPDGAYRLNGGASVNYMDRTLLGLLGLGGTSVALPVFVRPAIGTDVVAGTYRDMLTIAWSWHSCDAISLGGLCLGRNDGNGETKLEIVLTVAPRPLELTGSVRIVDDPVNGGSNPKALPGGSVEQTVQVHNPDIVPIDSGALSLVIRVPDRTRLLLGDRGTGAGPAATRDGSPASNLAVRFTGFAGTDDDLDFSRNGTDWTYVPVADARGVDPLVTHVRVRPRGAMPAGSRYAVGLRFRIE